MSKVYRTGFHVDGPRPLPQFDVVGDMIYGAIALGGRQIFRTVANATASTNSRSSSSAADGVQTGARSGYAFDMPR